MRLAIPTERSALFGALAALGATQAGVGERQLDVDERARARRPG